MCHTFIGNGKCTAIEKTKCEVNATCTCFDMKRDKTHKSTFSGEECKCCEAGACKKNCFNRFSDQEMCSGHGTCDCSDSSDGQTCKVLRLD